MSLQALLECVAADPNGRLSPPVGRPSVLERQRVPADLAEFYDRADGAVLFDRSPCAVTVSSPVELIQTNVVILGSEHPEDRSADWYVIARTDGRQLISIDLAEDLQRNGRCYDSWDETHGLAVRCR